MTAQHPVSIDAEAIRKLCEKAITRNNGEISDMLLDMECGDGKPVLPDCIALAVQARLALNIPALLSALAAQAALLEEAKGALEPMEKCMEVLEELPLIGVTDDQPVGEALYTFAQPTVGDLRRCATVAAKLRGGA